jgi:hypothetical protein
VTLRIDEPNGARAVVLEDDGKVAYAYLLEDGEVVGDVWLYNVAPAPETVNWRDRAAMPFLNPRKYCTEEVVPKLRHDSVVNCQWSNEGVRVTIDGLRMARLAHGAKPGWSRLASSPGPLARPLTEDA